jgi:hypothetical protein
MPWVCADARMLTLRSRLDAVRPAAAALSPPGLAGMIDERCELLAERRGVLLAQIDLILGAIDPKSPVSPAGPPIKIILELDGHLLRHPSFPATLGDTCTKINCTGCG